MQTAVIGAGLAGLAAARRLEAAGHEVTVFDKARGPGGRSSLRRVGDHAFDHGAQWFRVRTERFARHLEEALASGVVQPWEGRCVRLDADGNAVPERSPRSERPFPGEEPCEGHRFDGRRFVGVPGMNALAKDWAAEVRLRLETRVQRVGRSEAGFRLVADRGDDLGTFDRLVVALPSEQAAALAPGPGLAGRARAVAFHPCQAVLLGFPGVVPAAFDGAKVVDGRLGWVARNDSKPGRGDASSWVLHGAPDYSRESFDAPAERVIAELRDAFQRLLDTPLPTPVVSDHHRWRYALARPGERDGFLADPEVPGCVLVGDWTLGANVEAAVLSGEVGATHLLEAH